MSATPEGLHDAEAGVVVDLFLSYRSVKGWPEMIALVQKMSAPLSATPVVREQLGFALNRAGESERAEAVLLDVIASRGPSSEPCGILGRVYKDRYDAALKRGETFAARGFLSKAIQTYLQGFETDWRDAYPGVNAVSLMELQDKRDERQAQLLPVVRYSAMRKADKNPDYWDHATLMELAVLSRDDEAHERRDECQGERSPRAASDVHLTDPPLYEIARCYGRLKVRSNSTSVRTP